MDHYNTLIFIVLLLCLTTYTNQFPQKYCYRYGSDSSLDNLELGLKGKVYTNLETSNKIQIAFFTKREECEASCKKSKYYHGCLQSNSSYDLQFGITKGSFVCWLKDLCYKRTNEFEEFRNKDAVITYSSVAGCSYLCNTIYMKKGHCMINKDFNYYCYYKTKHDENMTEKEKLDLMEKKARALAKVIAGGSKLKPTTAPAPANPAPAPATTAPAPASNQPVTAPAPK